MGRAGEATQWWDNQESDLPTDAVHGWRVLRAAWEWVNTKAFEAEREYLAAHPILQDPANRPWIIQVLRYQDPDKANRYLTNLNEAGH